MALQNIFFIMKRKKMVGEFGNAETNIKNYSTPTKFIAYMNGKSNGKGLIAGVNM